jgi:thiol-disulfide isomerase/thioredoxin
MKMKITLPALIVLAAVFAVILGGIPARPQDNGTFAVGKVVPADLKLKDINGKEYTLQDYRGKIVFIHFWSIVCPYEQLAEPKCIALQKDFGSQGVVQIAINANQGELQPDSNPPYANLRDHVEKAGVNFLVTVDPGNKITDILGGKSTPHCFVIDKDGVLRYNGALDDDPRGQKGKDATEYVRNAIAAVLAGKEVPVKTTQSYG